MFDSIATNENLQEKRKDNVLIISNCFRFTWLGPKFNSKSNFRNSSCSDVIKGDKSVPCVHPLVVTSKFSYLILNS